MLPPDPPPELFAPEAPPLPAPPTNIVNTCPFVTIKVPVTLPAEAPDPPDLPSFPPFPPLPPVSSTVMLVTVSGTVKVDVPGPYVFVAAKDFCEPKEPTHNPISKAKYPVLLGRLKMWDFRKNMSGDGFVNLTSWS